MRRILIGMLLAMLSMAADAQSESQTEYNFLRLPASAHAAALGGDNISIVEDDEMMMLQNPALLLGVTPKMVTLGYMNYMSGCNYAMAAYNTVIDEKWNVGVAAQYMSYGSMKQTDAANNDLGTFSAQDLAVSGTLAYELATNLSGGITARFIHGNIGSYNSMAVGVDLGLNYYDPESEWSFAFTGRNLGGQIKSYDETFEKMPIDFLLGVSKRLVGSPLRLSMTLGDLGHWSYKFIDHVTVGADVILSPQLYVAGGYSFRRAHEMEITSGEGEKSSHGAGFSLGVGVLLDRFKVNVAYGKYHVSASSLMANVAFTL